MNAKGRAHTYSLSTRVDAEVMALLDAAVARQWAPTQRAAVERAIRSYWSVDEDVDAAVAAILASVDEKRVDDDEPAASKVIDLMEELGHLSEPAAEVLRRLMAYEARTIAADIATLLGNRIAPIPEP